MVKIHSAQELVVMVINIGPPWILAMRERERAEGSE